MSTSQAMTKATSLIQGIGGTAVIAGAIAAVGWYFIQQHYESLSHPAVIVGEIPNPPGAIVIELDNGAKRTTAHESEGFFRLEDVSPGKHLIAYKYAGYTPRVIKVTIVGGRENYLALEPLAPVGGGSMIPIREVSVAVLETKSTKGKCESVVSIRKLGWRSGHKTKFCIALGYDGSFNPFADYSSGGYCFKGDLDACKQLAEAKD